MESTKQAQCSQAEYDAAKRAGLLFAQPGTNEFDAALHDFARAIEQAVLQSPEVQAWKKDAGRYQFAAQHCVLGGGVYKFGWPVAPVGKRQFDKYLDAAMEKQP